MCEFDEIDLTQAAVLAQWRSRIADIANALKCHKISFEECGIVAFVTSGKWSVGMPESCEDLLYGSNTIAQAYCQFITQCLLSKIVNIPKRDYPGGVEALCECYADPARVACADPSTLHHLFRHWYTKQRLTGENEAASLVNGELDRLLSRLGELVAEIQSDLPDPVGSGPKQQSAERRDGAAEK